MLAALVIFDLIKKVGIAFVHRLCAGEDIQDMKVKILPLNRSDVEIKFGPGDDVAELKVEKVADVKVKVTSTIWLNILTLWGVVEVQVRFGGVRIRALRAPAFKRPASAMESNEMLGSNEMDENMVIHPGHPSEPVGGSSTAADPAEAAEGPAVEFAVGSPQHRAAVLAAQSQSPPTGIGSLSRVLDSIEEEFAFALGVTRVMGEPRVIPLTESPSGEVSILVEENGERIDPNTGQSIAVMMRRTRRFGDAHYLTARIKALSKSILHADREKVDELIRRKEVLNGLREAGQLEEEDRKTLLTSKMAWERKRKGLCCHGCRNRSHEHGC